ncbi:cytochrome c oxidase subunit II [Synechocystis sp. LEGE 06083]|uniref:cytochrome c oxidase subunit II n=1 Tax=Synechocystis sp. LEGE 06083 TaxID=915336 RepID=UPI001882C19D|nr:cytochrome c oxidase subunit II [Synechocystis sp. LEGE 06083]
MKIPGSVITLLIGVVVTVVSLWYGQNHGLMPVAASADAEEVDGIFNYMMTIATGLFLLVEGVLVYCLIRFRRRKGDQTDGPPIEGNVPLEILWTAIPTVIVFTLAVYSFEVYNNLGGLDPTISRDNAGQQMAHNHMGHMGSMGNMVAMSGDGDVALGIGLDSEEQGVKPLMVDVKGIQYAWIFTYPETGIISGELHAPIDRPVQLNMEAGDVIHAFWVPQLRLKQDVIPGRGSTLVFNASTPGQYPVICAELCGAYHGGMKSVFYAHTPEEYDDWVAANAPAPTESMAMTLPKATTAMTPEEYLAPYVKEMGVETKALAQLKDQVSPVKDLL